MAIKTLFRIFVLTLFLSSCSKLIDYSEEFKIQTSGKYLYNEDDVIAISYEDNTLFMKWRGVKTKPVATSKNEFFVPDMYKKLHFVHHPKTNEWYLSIIQETKTDSITYDYIKVLNNYKTPTQYLIDGNYEKALEGYLKIRTKDSTSEFIQQYKFNRIANKKMQNKDYDDAISIYKINTVIHSTKFRVYNNLAKAYLKIGDSLQAYANFKISLGLNNTNKSAQNFVDAYELK